jgi:phage tail-like protein
MAKSTVNPQRYDPYKNFKFRITIDGKIVAATNDISGLVPLPGSGKKKARRKMPGLQRFGNIEFKRSITQDTKFLEWIKSTRGKSAADAGLANLRKNMMIECCNESGDVIASYRVINGWVTKMEAPDLDANANDFAIESIELSYEGLELIKS